MRVWVSKCAFIKVAFKKVKLLWAAKGQGLLATLVRQSPRG